MSRVIARFILVFCILFFMVILASAITGIDPTTDSTASATEASPTTTATPTPSGPTPAPSTGSQPANPLVTALKDVLEWVLGVSTRTTHMLQAFWPLLVGLLIIYLIFVLAYRALGETQDYRLEFDKLQNGTGDAEFDAALAGLEALVREKLILQVKQLKNNIDGYARQVAEGVPFPSGAPIKQDAGAKAALDKVIEALGDDSPKYAKSLLSLWEYLFPARGTRVRMTLQAGNDKSQNIAITFEFLDLNTQENSLARTIREEKAVEPTLYPWLSCSEPPSEEQKDQEEESSPGPARQAVPPDWLQKAAQELESASLYEDALDYYEKALAENKTDPDLPGALTACRVRLSQRAARAAIFKAAARLEESQLFEAAAKGYAEVFQNPRDVRFARGRWHIAFDLRTGGKGDALNQLAEKYLAIADLHDEALGLFKRAMEEGNAAALQTFQRIQREQADALVKASGYLFQNAQWVAADKYLTLALANVPDHREALHLQSQLQASQPAQEDKEALAAFELGTLYLEQGDPAKASEYFVKALEKQPEYEEAQKALTKVLDPALSLRARYGALLDNALAWLAVELFRQQTDRNAMSTGAFQIKKARYHNFYGAHLLSFYERLPTFFGRQAEADLREAIRVCPSWWQPYKQLGDLYSLRGLNEAKGDVARRFLREAAAWYEAALAQQAFRPDGTPTAFTDPTRRLRIQMNRLNAAFLACPTMEELDGLWDEIKSIESQIRGGQERPKLIKLEANPNIERVYFGLATWYALVDYRFETTKKDWGSPAPKKAKDRARFYLTCSLLLNPGLVRELDLNKLLKRLFEDKSRKDLVHWIELRRIRQKQLSSTNPPYWEDAYEVLRKIIPGFQTIF